MTPRRLLIVDDDESTTYACSLMLEGPVHCVVQTAASGAEALALCREIEFHVVLLDVGLLDMTGFDVARRLGSEAMGRPRVVFVSGMAVNREARAHGIELGAYDYLLKPVDPDDLIMRIDLAFRMRESEEEVARQRDEVVRLEENYRAAQDLRRRARVLEAIVESQRRILAEDAEIDEALTLIADRVMELTEVPAVGIELLDGDELVCLAAAGRLRPIIGRRLHRMASLSGLATITKEVLSWQDIHQDPRVDARVCGEIGLCSVAVVPLLTHSEPIGVLKLASDREGESDPSVLETAEMMAGTVTTAVSHYLSLRSYVRRQSEREQAERMSGVRQTVHTLEHEINNPLQALLGSVELLARRQGVSSGPADACVSRIEQASIRIRDVVRRMSHITTVETTTEAGIERIRLPEEESVECDAAPPVDPVQ